MVARDAPVREGEVGCDRDEGDARSAGAEHIVEDFAEGAASFDLAMPPGLQRHQRRSGRGGWYAAAAPAIGAEVAGEGLGTLRERDGHGRAGAAGLSIL